MVSKSSVINSRAGQQMAGQGWAVRAIKQSNPLHHSVNFVSCPMEFYDYVHGYVCYFIKGCKLGRVCDKFRKHALIWFSLCITMKWTDGCTHIWASEIHSPNIETEYEPEVIINNPGALCLLTSLHHILSFFILISWGI